MEHWEWIEDFPTYKISDYGRVLNDDSGRILKESTTRGLVKVGLMLDNKQYTRSVALLVAETFVEGKTIIFDTPMHLDGNRSNNRADNLVWRPRWFAWKFSRQFVEFTSYMNRGPIIDLENELLYPTFLDASIDNGILLEDIQTSITYKKKIFPTGQIFNLLV